jgi:hypothetical protein
MELGITHLELARKLLELIRECDRIYHLRKSDKVQIGDRFEVSGFTHRKEECDHCLFCGHKITSPAVYTIENLQMGEKIQVSELAIHVLTHNYYVKPAPCRIDHPVKVCRVLGLR